MRFVRDGSESQAAAQLLLAAAWRATTHKRQITAGKQRTPKVELGQGE